MTNRLEMLETGLHENVPWERYAQIPAINSGIVRWGIKATPLHMHAARQGLITSDDTTDRRHGRHIHARILEPETYRERFLIATNCVAVTGRGEVCDKRAKYRDADGNWFCGTHKPKGEHTEPQDFVTVEQAARTERIAEKLHQHPAMALLRREYARSEVTGLWEWYGLPMKCRMDRYASGERPTIVDLKKCQVGAASRMACEKAIAEHRYDVQAAMYVDCVQQTDNTKAEFWWVFIEDGEPFDVMPLHADDETLAIGRHDTERTLSVYASQLKHNDLRGFLYDPRIIRRGGLPSYFRRPYREAGVTSASDDTEQRENLADFGTGTDSQPELIPMRDDGDSDIPY